MIHGWKLKKQNKKNKKTEKCGVQKLTPLSQYFAEPSFAAMTAASLLGQVSSSNAHVETEIFAHSSLQNSSSLVWLDWESVYSNFQVLLEIANWFRSELWLGHSNTWVRFDQNHSIVALALGLGSCPTGRCTSTPVSSLLETPTSFLPRLSCIWLHPSSHQLRPASLSLPKKSIPTAWCYHHHVSRWGWCVQGDAQCFLPHIAFCI